MGHQLNFFRVLFCPCFKYILFSGFCVKYPNLNMQLRKWRVKENWSYEAINLYHHHQLAYDQLIRDCLLIYQIVMTRPGGNKFSLKSNGNWCAASTHPVLELLKYMHTQTFQNKNAFCYIAAFPLSVLWYRLKQDYEQRNIELNHEKLLFKWLVFLL